MQSPLRVSKNTSIWLTMLWAVCCAGAVRGQFEQVPGTEADCPDGMGPYAQFASNDPAGACLNEISAAPTCEINGGGKAGGPAGCNSCSGASNGSPYYVPPARLPGVGRNMPFQPSGFFSYNSSVIDNRYFSYRHSANDYPKADSATIFLERIFRSRDASKPGSFGPMMFSNFDVRMTVSLDNFSPSHVSIFDPLSTNEIYLMNAYQSTEFFPDTDVPINRDYRDKARVKRLVMLSSSMQEFDDSDPMWMLDFSDAKYGRLELWEGGWFLFELVNTELPPSQAGTAKTHGRLLEARAADNSGFTISYKNWTSQQLEESPSRLWQIQTVTDKSGPAFTFTYNSQMQSGSWAVSSIAFPDTSTVSYSYAGGFLTGVTHADATTSSFAYSSGANGLVMLTIHDLTAEPGHRHKQVAMAGAVATIGNTVVATSVGVVRAVANGEDEITYGTARLSSDEALIYEGGGLLRNGVIIDSSYNSYVDQFYESNWVMNADSEGKITVTGTADAGAIYKASFLNAFSSSLYRPDFTDERGIERSFGFDERSNTSFIYYNDDTFEASGYDATTNQLIRHRDRSGNVTRYVFNAAGQLIETRVGLVDGPSNQGVHPLTGTYNRNPGDDIQTSVYAVSYRTYYASGTNVGKLASTIDELGNTTNFEYDASGRMVKVIQPPDVAGGIRAETGFTYDPSGRLKTVTDALGTVTEHFYDSMGRRVKTTYADGSSERVVYGTTGSSAGLKVQTIDRANIVTTYAYDDADRPISRIGASAVDDGNGNQTATPTLAVEDTWTYLNGTSKPVIHSAAGQRTEFFYDYRGRVKRTTVFPRVGSQLVTTNHYLNNQLFFTEDAYGRKSYQAYDATDGRLIRTVKGTVPSYSLASYAEVISATRSSAPNASFVINDVVRDAEGRIDTLIDPLGTITKYSYDARDRQTDERRGFGLGIEARTQTLVDLASNVIEKRSPRYFDSSDTEGYQKAKETWTYNGRNKMSSHSDGVGSGVQANESFTYDLKGRPSTHTDFAGKVWTTIYDACCDKSIAAKNPLGHGAISNRNARGLVVHTVQVADVDEHVVDMTSPVNNKTLAERTTRYDGRGRSVATTVWLSALGAVNPEDPPIAGWNSIPASSGLTTQYLYDDNLADGQGLDSGSGSAYTKMAVSGTAAVSLSGALSKLASPPASGGAEISFSSSSPGRATVVISPQDEISFTIHDAAGRVVMSGQLDNYTGTANALLAWTSTIHDAVTNVAGFGDCLETKSVDAMGKVAGVLHDSAGRMIRSVDQLGKLTSYSYDASGNRLSTRDPNNVGQDVVYDALGRTGLTTDTGGDTTNSTYDKAGNRIGSIDGKTHAITYIFDARGRQKGQIDRNSGTTKFSYLATGQLASLTDAELQTTNYTYDDAGQKLTERYPDHTGGTPGQSSYGIVTFVNDAAGRVQRKQDQKGDTCTFTYDLASRLTKREYRTLANSPSGTVADTDSFTYDKAGRMLTAESGRYANTVTYTYDAAGRKKTEALTISQQTYTTTNAYNSRGELVTLTYPDGTLVNREYTDRGELHRLKHAGTVIDTRAYDDGGRMASSSYNNGVGESRSYNSDNTLAAINFTGAAIGNLAYGWDDNKNKISETIAGTMSDFGFTVPANGYDHEDRLVSYKRTGGMKQAWNLSPVGDWNSVTTDDIAQTRTHGPTHELLNVGGSSISTDSNGNITMIPGAVRADQQSLTLRWDFDNRLSSALKNSVIVANYKFDALGRRVCRQTRTESTVYVQAGQQTLADYVAGAAAASPTYRYVYASYIDEPVLRYKPTGAESLYYHRNQQYSVVALTDANGSIVERYAYTAYGVPTFANASGSELTASAYANRYTYTGREWDPILRLYHYRARLYEPVLGRFCGRDPLTIEGSFCNHYELAFARILISSDPSGLRSCTSFGDKNKPKQIATWGEVCWDVDFKCEDGAIALQKINFEVTDAWVPWMTAAKNYPDRFQVQISVVTSGPGARISTIDCPCDCGEDQKGQRLTYEFTVEVFEQIHIGIYGWPWNFPTNIFFHPLSPKPNSGHLRSTKPKLLHTFTVSGSEDCCPCTFTIPDIDCGDELCNG